MGDGDNTEIYAFLGVLTIIVILILIFMPVIVKIDELETIPGFEPIVFILVFTVLVGVMIVTLRFKFKSINHTAQ